MWKKILLLLGLSGHVSPITKLYHHVDQKMSWTDAQRYCREKFHDLATVDNLEELERLKESRNPNYDDVHTWIGLQDDITRWQWADNQDYKMGQDYGNWDQSEPNNEDGGQNCTMISIISGMWKDVRCHSAINAVCINAEGNYIYVQEKMTFDKAMEYCQSEHTELASVRDAIENDKIIAVMQESVWIGLHRNLWSHWSDGSRATYFNWGRRQPNSGMQNCLAINFINADYNDLNCETLYYVACQTRQIQHSTFKLNISTEADMTDPEVQRQFLEQLSAKMAMECVTGLQLRWVVKDGQGQQSKK